MAPLSQIDHLVTDSHAESPNSWNKSPRLGVHVHVVEVGDD